MSILRFLRVITQPRASERSANPRQRKLAMESLEERSVLTLLHPLLANPSLSLVIAPPPVPTLPAALVPIEIAGGPTLPPPSPIDPPPNPFEDPPPPGPEENPGDDPPEVQAPTITSLGFHRSDDWVWFSGTAIDDKPLIGLIVHFSSDQGHVFTTILNPTGTFHTMGFLIDPGTQVAAHFFDTDENQSETALVIV